MFVEPGINDDGSDEDPYVESRPEKVLAYLRIYEGEILLCVVNLCETAQAAELDLGEWAGLVPVEMFGGCPFPAIRKAPYTVTLPGREFLWLKLFPPDQVDPVKGVPGERMDRPDLPAPDKPLPVRPRERAGGDPSRQT